MNLKIGVLATIVVLLAGCGLMVRSVARMVRTDLRVEMADGAITLTSGVFELFAIQDGDDPASIFNISFLLKNTGRRTHAGAVGAEHGGQKIMGNKHGASIHAVMSHEQPARETLFDIM